MNQHWSGVKKMIDEKQLIEDFKNTFSDSVLNQTFGFGKYTFLEAIEEMINRQPQIVTDTNVGSKWIPCEERLPDKTMLCLCTVERGVTPYHGLNPIIDWWIVKENEQVSLFEAKKGHWKNQCNKVIAWQPLPQPYKKEGDSDAT